MKGKAKVGQLIPAQTPEIEDFSKNRRSSSLPLCFSMLIPEFRVVKFYGKPVPLVMGSKQEPESIFHI